VVVKIGADIDPNLEELKEVLAAEKPSRHVGWMH